MNATRHIVGGPDASGLRVNDVRGIEVVRESGERVGFAIEVGGGEGRTADYWIAFTVHPMSEIVPGVLGHYVGPSAAYNAIAQAEVELDEQAALLRREGHV